MISSIINHCSIKQVRGCALKTMAYQQADGTLMRRDDGTFACSIGIFSLSI